jgi:hypothetical protein
MLLLVSLLDAAISLGFSSASAADPQSEVSVAPTASAFSAGGDIEFQVTNLSAASIFVAACGSLQAEILVDEHYEPLPPTPCQEEGLAQSLPVGDSKLSFPAPAELAGRTGRVALVFGLGCVQKRPLSRARCSDFRTVRSRNFRIKSAGP